MAGAINYKHLYYFWMVAKVGGVIKAGERLHVTPQTISGQLSKFEQQIGSALFLRQGKKMVITEFGAVVKRYADEIFELGQELEDVMRGGGLHHPIEVVVGIADVIPKSIAYRIIEPALKAYDNLRIVCRESTLDGLLAELATHRLDVVLSDQPLSSRVSVKAYNHELGASSISFFASESLAEQLKGSFPQNLHGANFLMPTTHNYLRQNLESWFRANDIAPIYRAEIDDTALMKCFAQAGIGVLAAPTVIRREICKQYQLQLLGTAEEMQEKYYAISVERKIYNPAVLAITEQARRQLFRSK